MTELVSEPEAARLLGVSRSTFRRMREEGHPACQPTRTVHGEQRTFRRYSATTILAALDELGRLAARRAS